MIRRVLLLCGALVLGFGFAGFVTAQVPADSIEARAERDFHGPDGVGKDGPLSAAGLDLLRLYHRYQVAETPDAFTPQQSGVQVTDGRVRVEALARDEAAQLRTDLEKLGMRDIAVAGRLVAGELPIDRIPDAARLKSLRGLMVPQGDTRTIPSPSVGTPDSPPPAPPSDSVEEDASSDETGGGAILFLVGSGVVLLLIEEL